MPVDQHERLECGDHQDVVRDPVGGVLVRRARAADTPQTDEDLEQVVEACRREILDRRGTHDELVVSALKRDPGAPAPPAGALFRIC